MSLLMDRRRIVSFMGRDDKRVRGDRSSGSNAGTWGRMEREIVPELAPCQPVYPLIETFPGPQSAIDGRRFLGVHHRKNPGGVAVKCTIKKQLP